MSVTKFFGLNGVRKFLESLFEKDVHAMRILSMANATLGVLSSSSHELDYTDLAPYRIYHAYRNNGCWKLTRGQPRPDNSITVSTNLYGL
jgi:hypothetical protein